MKTSNFSRGSKLPGAISIARGTPWWFHGPRYGDLEPSWELIADGKAGRRAEYTERYEREVLGRLDPARVAEEIHAIVSPHEPILLCWEAPGEFCHRRIIARWLNAAGVVEGGVSETEPAQGDLFGGLP